MLPQLTNSQYSLTPNGSSTPPFATAGSQSCPNPCGNGPIFGQQSPYFHTQQASLSTQSTVSLIDDELFAAFENAENGTHPNSMVAEGMFVQWLAMETQKRNCLFWVFLDEELINKIIGVLTRLMAKFCELVFCRYKFINRSTKK